MQLTGRTYIFAAATLMLLAGSLRFYSDAAEEQPGLLSTLGTGIKTCQSQSVRTANVRLGCQSDMFGNAGGGKMTSRAGAKTIQIGG